MKYEKINTILNSKGITDRKHKLNTTPKPVNESFLTAIEQGVTIEQLAEMEANGLDIFKYNTQITIHGLFPDLRNNYVGGYMNIFQNKNRSIGVKYNAIDEDKRLFIAERIKPLGFKYSRDSSWFKFSQIQVLSEDKSEADLQLSKAKELAAKIDNNLFYGTKCLWIGGYWGRKYLILEFSVGAIYQKDVETLLNGMGATKDILEVYQVKQQDKELERKRYWEAYRQEQEREESEALKSMEQDIKTLETYPKVHKSNEPGIYIKYGIDHNNKPRYTVTEVVSVKGKQKPRYNKQEFNNLPDAMAYTPKGVTYSSSILKYGITGYKVK